MIIITIPANTVEHTVEIRNKIHKIKALDKQ